MSLQGDYLGAMEEHSVQGIADALSAGASPVDPIDGRAPITYLIEGYCRSTRFADCLRVLLSAGATIDDPVVEAILLGDATRLEELIGETKGEALHRPLDLRCAFTACVAVTPLHLCAEFNGVDCARVLLAAGADVNAPAGIDEDGFGGQTPIYHCVNSNRNFSRPMLELLVDAKAKLDITIRGLVWGRDMPWETVILDVTPLSYAQCGLYAQFHRNERDVYDALAYLYRHRHGTELRVRNVPNRYLGKA